ncbi:hypothetical protein P4114_00435 [Pseudomonas aeruginosa]|nr:hypothetical protein [Pseudomonas aeruginosa]
MGEPKEGDASTGKWQELTPSLSLQLRGVSQLEAEASPQAVDGDYAWALWASLPCCQRKGQTRQY